MSTPYLKRVLARAAGISAREIGSAGQKDRCAVTTQWLSMPVKPVDPELEGLQILECQRHGNKLRMGHLKGNRFQILLRGVHAEAPQRLPALLGVLGAGFPNYFGPQRFASANLEEALRMLQRRGRPPQNARFLASALQSALFNLWLGQRVKAETLHSARPGEVLRKRLSGGLFLAEDPELERPRLDSGEIDPAGPMFGPKAFKAAGAAAEEEALLLERLKLGAKELKALSRLAPGTRRAARVQVKDLELEWLGEDLRLSFTLPKGSFATVFLGALSA